ncbi:hypothetical protein LTR36_006561 [Oleoguttula mirabilis]|uniref:cutinase n=1 Tax=Oleoguttula mirabilis TaxID=1507867 RepID=A0AAV9JVE8_9PEZI|nr:hypothetical protein LTR36_006561 [Oleoguttula mirabilis]
MQFTATLSYLLYAASVAIAAPLHEKRTGTSYTSGTTATDVTDGGKFLRRSFPLGLPDNIQSGVDYTASIASNIDMGSKGGPVMAQLVATALKNCPNTKIAISGYSQGGEVCHYAVKSGGLSADDVSAAVIYGDPEDGTSVGDLPASKLKEFCASGDGVCEDHTFDISAAHLSYSSSSDIEDGAQFIISAAGATATSSGSSSNTTSSSTTSSSASATSSSSSLASILSSLSGSDDSSELSGLSGLFKRFF